MNFRYRRFPVNAKNCPFPDKKSALRPVIQVDFETPNGKFGYLVLIDSGADYCIFHASVGEQLGLDIKSGKLLICDVGFSYDMEKLAYGLLGQDGFFNRWVVKFEYQKENIDLREILPR